MKNAKPAVAGREKSQRVFFVHIGDLAKQKGFGVMESLRQAGIVVSESLGKDLPKAQMRLADKEGAAIALIFGQKEVFEDSIIVRDMRSGAQEAVPLKDLAEVLKKRLKDQRLEMDCSSGKIANGEIKDNVIHSDEKTVAFLGH